MFLPQTRKWLLCYMMVVLASARVVIILQYVYIYLYCIYTGHTPQIYIICQLYLLQLGIRGFEGSQL